MDIYSEKDRKDLINDDEIDDFELGFMEGYCSEWIFLFFLIWKTIKTEDNAISLWDYSHLLMYMVAKRQLML